MKLVACLYIDDDGLGGTLAIYDSPCSQPACIHADLPLSPGEVATLLAYIESTVRGGNVEDCYVSRFQEHGVISCGNRALIVNIYNNATFSIAREDVILDLSSNFCEEIDGLEARLGIEDVE